MYTQGEWKTEGLKIRVFGAGIIAQCPTPQNGGVFECVANARLIAAAPEIYQALRTIVEAIANNETDRGIRVSQGNGIAALMKVEGKE